MNKKELALHIIKCLNEYLALDYKPIQELVEYRVPVSDLLADHSHIQVVVESSYSTPMLGLLGILNGICGIIPGTSIGYITAVFNDDSQKLIRFELSDPNKYNLPI
jgi:hypothetical protein